MNYKNNEKFNITDKKTLLRTVTIIHGALIAGLVLFALVTIFVANKGQMAFSIPNANDAYTFVVLFMAIACPVAGTILFNGMIKKIKQQELLTDKIQLYMNAIIIRCALAEGASLFAIVVSMLTFNTFYLVIAGILILYMISFRPTADRIDIALDLSFEDKIAFESQNDFR